MRIDPVAVAIDLRKRYWSFNKAEYEHLHAKLKQGTTWSERLRLLHLCCAGMMRTKLGEAVLRGDFADDDLDHPLAKMASELADTLVSEKSPYRPRNTAVWHGTTPPPDDKPPDHIGVVYNPSLTHLGCIEYITMDEQGNPGRVGFAPLHRVRTLVMASPALFRTGKIFFEDQREEVVIIPLVYGLSWLSRESYDRDGSMTRFALHTNVPQLGEELGIGLGQQDWAVSGQQGAALIGIGSIAMADMPLDLRDCDWEAKARMRGLDPEEIKRKFPPPG